MIRQLHERERVRLRNALNHPSESRWENLGLWTPPVRDYPDAARALALRVAQTAGLAAGDAVLDIGPGVAGQQETLWREDFGIGTYYGWERTTPPPQAVRWQHVLAVDSAYLVPGFAARIGQLWPRITPGGSVTWTDLYLRRPDLDWRTRARLRATSLVAGIDWHHWRSPDQWRRELGQLHGARLHFEDLTDAVLRGFVEHIDHLTRCTGPQPDLRLARGTAALLRPLLATHAAGYGLFCVRRGPRRSESQVGR